MPTIRESVMLHFTNGGSSDKVYNIYLEEHGPGQFTVTGFNGKRGATLTPRPQTTSPVSYNAAKQIFDDLENKKRTDRKSPYSVIERNGAPPTGPQDSNSTSLNTHESTGYIAIHPKKISEDEAAKLFSNDNYLAEQKCDGEFMSLLYTKGRVVASNKLGNGIPVPPELASAICTLATISGCDISLGLAGEFLDSSLHVFTVWEKNGVSLLTLPQHLRVSLKNKLKQLLDEHRTSSETHAAPCMKFIFTAETSNQKIALYERVKAGDGEGIVFKHRECNTSFKLKLYETTEVLLIANSKRSAECFAYHNGILISLGSTTLPTDAVHKQIHEANLRQQAIIGSVRYLYLSAPPTTTSASGKLTQSNFIRFRPEFTEKSCVTDELKVVNKTVLTALTPTSTEAPATATTTPTPEIKTSRGKTTQSAKHSTNPIQLSQDSISLTRPVAPMTNSTSESQTPMLFLL